MDDAFGQLGVDNFSTGCYVSRQIRFGNNMKFPFTQIILQSRQKLNFLSNRSGFPTNIKDNKERYRQL